MPKESHLELRVGFFVLVAIVVLTIFVWSVNSTTSIRGGKKYKIIFEFANGLKKDAPVRVAGVSQGIVKDIDLFFDRQDSKTKAEVIIEIRKDLEISTDSLVMINQLGLLGEKYVEIIPGVDTKSFFQVGQSIRGKDPVAQEFISEKIMDVAKKLDQTVYGFNQIISDEQNQQSIQSTLKHFSAIAGSMDEMMAYAKEGKGNIGLLFYDDSLYNDLNGLTSELKKNPWKLLHRPK